MDEVSTISPGDITAFLRHMIANPYRYRFKLRCYHGQFNGVEVGLVEATNKRPWVEHTMNKAELDKVVTAKHEKKLGEAHIAATKLNGTPVSEWCGAIDAETLQNKLRDRPTRWGSAGEFYTFPLSLITTEEDPF